MRKCNRKPHIRYISTKGTNGNFLVAAACFCESSMDDMSFKWTNDISITLIELYREFECLWNPLDSKYKCRNEKHGAWVRLSDATGADISEVKRKIKNLVAQFYRERRKYRQLNKSGAGATFISKWFAYKYLEFLADKNRVRQCTEKGFNDTK
ncbi:hypothetical protein Cfor_01507, partial [Coptotermes formosanus]